MSIKIVTKNSETFEIIRSAVNKVVDLIQPTYGPAGNKVIISKVMNRIVVDDGVQIARDLELPDPAENAVLNVIRETAVKTNDRAGDGTTGSLIMLRAIVEAVAARPGAFDGREIEKELKKGFDECEKQLRAMAEHVKTQEELERVARISFDDQTMAKLIAKAWFTLGKDGVLTVDRSGTMETVLDISEGVKIDRGYVSPYMITNPQRMEGVIEKPYILLTDYRLTEASDVIGVMNLLAAKNVHNLVIICEHIENSALGTLIVNKMQGKFNAIAVNAPEAGDDRSIFLEDVALMTGAKLFSEKKGDKLENAKLEDLGRADRFIARRTNSVIVGPKGKKAEVKNAIDALQKAVAAATDESNRKSLQRRLARFAGKIGVIKVGAATENEERALRYKVEDAINATLSAYKGGVVPGAGLALAGLDTSSPILNAALKKPFEQLKKNVGLASHADLKKGEAVNVVTGKVGNFMDVGVMDPVEVILAGVESAVSIANILITSSGMIVEEPKKIPTEGQQ